MEFFGVKLGAHSEKRRCFVKGFPASAKGNNNNKNKPKNTLGTIGLNHVNEFLCPNCMLASGRKKQHKQRIDRPTDQPNQHLPDAIRMMPRTTIQLLKWSNAIKKDHIRERENV